MSVPTLLYSTPSPSHHGKEPHTTRCLPFFPDTTVFHCIMVQVHGTPSRDRVPLPTCKPTPLLVTGGWPSTFCCRPLSKYNGRLCFYRCLFVNGGTLLSLLWSQVISGGYPCLWSRCIPGEVPPSPVTGPVSGPAGWGRGTLSRIGLPLSQDRGPPPPSQDSSTPSRQFRTGVPAPASTGVPAPARTGVPPSSQDSGMSPARTASTATQWAVSLLRSHMRTFLLFYDIHKSIKHA